MKFKLYLQLLLGVLNVIIKKHLGGSSKLGAVSYTHLLVTSFSGGIHISQAQKGYVAKLTDEFRIGDLIEAKVTKIIGIDNVDLTTAEEELGVLKAMCTKCRHYMKQTSRNEVECPNCGNKERRNLSSKYEG